MNLTRFPLLIFATAAFCAGCWKSKSPLSLARAAEQPSLAISPPAPAAKIAPSKETDVGRIDVSAVLTKDDIQSVLGEPPQDTKRSGKSAGGFAVSQCFFTLPTFTKSIVVTVTDRGEGPDARDPKEFWAATFHKDEDAKNGRPGEREEEEGKRLPPEKVEGTGDEAFWSGTRVGGTLYVLKGNKFVSVGIGGADDAPTRLKKAKALADLLVKRL